MSVNPLPFVFVGLTTSATALYGKPLVGLTLGLGVVFVLNIVGAWRS